MTVLLNRQPSFMELSPGGVLMLNQRYCPDSSLIFAKVSVFFISFPQVPGARKIFPYPFACKLRLFTNLAVFISRSFLLCPLLVYTVFKGPTFDLITSSFFY